MKNMCRKCPDCGKFNVKKVVIYEFVESKEPFKKFAMDIIGPIKGNYILTIIDYFSRHGFARSIKI